MKRDMHLIRNIVLHIENQSLEERGSRIEIEGYSNEIISFHIMLLDEAGLVKGDDMSGMTDIEWFADRLTWAGYEFLEASRDDKMWKKAIETITSKGGGLVFEVLKQLLISFTKEAVFE
jgi:hypothetical protein